MEPLSPRKSEMALPGCQSLEEVCIFIKSSRTKTVLSLFGVDCFYRACQSFRENNDSFYLWSSWKYVQGLQEHGAESRKEKWLHSSLVSGFLKRKALSRLYQNHREAWFYVYIFLSYTNFEFLRVIQNCAMGFFHFKEERLSSSGVHPRNGDEISVFCFASGPEECVWVSTVCWTKQSVQEDRHRRPVTHIQGSCLTLKPTMWLLCPSFPTYRYWFIIRAICLC